MAFPCSLHASAREAVTQGYLMVAVYLMDGLRYPGSRGLIATIHLIVLRLIADSRQSRGRRGFVGSIRFYLGIDVAGAVHGLGTVRAVGN